jgi:MYXO-CTERM domain-containing protein
VPRRRAPRPKTTLDLSVVDGEAGKLTFYAKDSANQTTVTSVDTEVDKTSTLVLYDVVNGYILDFDCSRILALDTDGHALKIVDRGTRQETRIDSLSYAPSVARLTPNGAIYIYGNTVREWDGNQAVTLDTQATANQMVVAGQYALWFGSQGVVRRDLVAATNTVMNYGVAWDAADDAATQGLGGSQGSSDDSGCSFAPSSNAGDLVPFGGAISVLAGLFVVRRRRRRESLTA